MEQFTLKSPTKMEIPAISISTAMQITVRRLSFLMLLTSVMGLNRWFFFKLFRFPYLPYSGCWHEGSPGEADGRRLQADSRRGRTLRSAWWAEGGKGYTSIGLSAIQPLEYTFQPLAPCHHSSQVQLWFQNKGFVFRVWVEFNKYTSIQLLWTAQSCNHVTV